MYMFPPNTFNFVMQLDYEISSNKGLFDKIVQTVLRIGQVIAPIKARWQVRGVLCSR